MKQSGIIYIISYFGEGEIRNIRKVAHEIQVEWWLKYKNYPIYIYANEYLENDYISHPQVHYIKSNRKTNTSESRNILLKNFYKSNYDFCIFMDNDAILINEFSDINIEDIFKIKVNNHNEVDIFCPLNPRQSPYKKFVNIKSDYKFAYWIGNFYGSIFYMKNIKKYKNKELYFDEEMFNLEDRDFAYKAMMNNISVFINLNCVFKDLSKNKSTITEIHLIEDRRRENENSKKLICNKYGFGLKRGRIIVTNEKEKYCKRNKVILLKREGSNFTKDLLGYI